MIRISGVTDDLCLSGTEFNDLITLHLNIHSFYV